MHRKSRTRTSVLLVVVLMTIASGLPAQSVQVEPWTWKNPRPQGNDLRGVRVLPDRTILAVGSGGMLLRSTDDGSSWETDPYPGGLRSLYAIDFPSQTLGFITGDDHEGVGKVARTTDGGISWSILPTTSFAALYGIHFLDANRGAVVGTGGTINSTTNGGTSWTQGSVGAFTDLFSVDIEFSARIMAGAAGGKVYYTPNSGTNWSAQNTGTSGAVRALRTRAANAIALGDQGLIAFKSTDIATWTPIESPVGAASFRAVNWVRDAVVVAVGTNGAAIRSDNWGLQWHDISPGGSSSFNAVHSVDSTLVVAAGDAGAMMKSTAGGTSWTDLSFGTSTTLNDVTVSPGGIRIAVGNSGMILRQASANADWVESPSTVSSTLLGVHAIDDDTLLAVGNNRILRSIDGGMTWDTVAVPATSNLRRVTSRNEVILAVGTAGVILRSTDTGLIWEKVESGVTFALRAVAFANDSTAVCIGSVGTIRRSTDAGVTWDSIPSPRMATLSGIAFEDELHGFIVGSALDLGLTGTLLETTDGGLSWSARSLAVPLDIGQTFLTYNAIGFREPSEWLFAANAGLFYRSTNGGSTWTRLLTGTSGTTNGLAWVGDRWIAAGTRGMILESPFGPSLSVSNSGRAMPHSLLVTKAFPNPFNPTTTIIVESGPASMVRVEVYDLVGRRVTALYEGPVFDGAPLSLHFNATTLPSGTYFVVSTTGPRRSILPLLLLR